MKKKILISAQYFQPAYDRFRYIFEKNNIEVVLPLVKEKLGESELLEYIHDIDGVLCGDDAFTEQVIRSAPRLKVISKWGTGIDSIHKGACKERGIVIRNTLNAFSDAVSDTVLGYMLCFSRNIAWNDKEMKQGMWKKNLGYALHEKVLGIIGLGNIGIAVAKRARAFGISILGNDIRDITADEILSAGLNAVKFVDKEKIYQEADFISLHCDLNETTYHLLGINEFKKMKQSAIIINTSRGAVIHEKDLIYALEKKIIAGAALDVFESEPLSIESPLLSMPNVLLSPHNSNNSPVAWERVHRNTIYNLLKDLGINPEF